MRCSPVGSTTLYWQRLKASMTGRKSTVPSVKAAKSLIAGWSSSTSPWSSAGDSSAVVWRTQGKPASIVAGVSRTPGIISSAHARVSGNAAFRLSSAGPAASSTSGSSAIVSRRLTCSPASAPIVMLKFEIRSPSCTSRDESAAKIFCWAPTSFDRSCSSVPSRARLTIAPPRSESAEYSSESFSDSAAVLPRTSGSWSSSSPGSGWPLRASPYPIRSFWRSSRVLVVSVPSTWSIWTGAAVCDAGMVYPSSASGAPGVPGRRSMNRLPSKKIRGRTFTSASSWIGSASSSSFIVTRTAPESAPADSTFDTLPISTPAIRTAWPCWIGGAFSKAALSSYGRVNGMSFEKAR